MQTEDFDYDLPPGLIAQHPPEHRGDSRMMVVHRDSGKIEHRRFSDLGEYVRPGDLWVFNDTRVEPARFFSNDGRMEILKLDAVSPRAWKCLVKPGKRLRTGRTIEIGGATGTVVEVLEPGGERIIEFTPEAPDPEKHGHLALPPYIERPDAASDRERYQTVYAREPGAIAAPTAGLHFDEAALEGLPHEFVTLHVGPGTFRPVSTERVEDHHMHSERYEVSGRTAERIGSAARVVAVGTTVVRVLESCAGENGAIRAGGGETGIFIHPPYEPKIVGALLTNFHLPRSTLLMLVSAFSSLELMREAYRQAVDSRYRFFSYGDCMLIV